MIKKINFDKPSHETQSGKWPEVKYLNLHLSLNFF